MYIYIYIYIYITKVPRPKPSRSEFMDIEAEKDAFGLNDCSPDSEGSASEFKLGDEATVGDGRLRVGNSFIGAEGCGDGVLRIELGAEIKEFTFEKPGLTYEGSLALIFLKLRGNDA